MPCFTGKGFVKSEYAYCSALALSHVIQEWTEVGVEGLTHKFLDDKKCIEITGILSLRPFTPFLR